MKPYMTFMNNEGELAVGVEDSGVNEVYYQQDNQQDADQHWDKT